MESQDEYDDGEPELEVVVDPGKPYLMPSYYNKSLTCFFPYPSDGPERLQHFNLIEASGRVSSVLTCSTHFNRACVLRTFKRAGFREVHSDNAEDPFLVGYIRHLDENADFEALDACQKVSSFPGTWCVGRKDRLSKLLTPYMKDFPEYRFHPSTWVLPDNACGLMNAVQMNEREQFYILKPRASSCGRGIRVISSHEARQLCANPPRVLIQEYVANPLLLNGYKFDLRLYVLVTSFAPLRCYIYDEGLVRFASEKYNSKKIKNRFMHLTNSTVNEENSKYEYSSGVGIGTESQSKWSFDHLRRCFESMGIDYDSIFDEIESIVVKSLIAAAVDVNYLVTRYVRNANQCFELFGFDILIDSNLKPWLIEINVAPSLKTPSALDIQIKDSMLADLLNIVGPEPYRVRGQSRKKEKALLDPTKSSTCVRRQELRGEDPKSLPHIQRMEEEFDRRGHFKRVFPTDISRSYLQYYRSSTTYLTERCISFLERKFHIVSPCPSPPLAAPGPRSYLFGSRTSTDSAKASKARPFNPYGSRAAPASRPSLPPRPKQPSSFAPSRRSLMGNTLRKVPCSPITTDSVNPTPSANPPQPETDSDGGGSDNTCHISSTEDDSDPLNCSVLFQSSQSASPTLDAEVQAADLMLPPSESIGPASPPPKSLEASGQPTTAACGLPVAVPSASSAPPSSVGTIQLPDIIGKARYVNS